MKYTVYIQEMVENFILNLSKQALFIKHYNLEELNKAEFLQLIPDVVRGTCLYHEYHAGIMYEAYEPFLDWIRLCYQEFYQDSMSPEEFLRTSDVYSLHIEPFASYIRTGECVRTEAVMYTELNFEQINFSNDILHILRRVAKEHTLVLILCEFHLAPLSSVQILLAILQKKIENLHFIVVYNDTYYPKPYLKTAWNQLISYTRDKNMLCEWGQFTSDIVMNSIDDFVFEVKDARRNITRLTNMYHTFALEDMAHYINDIYTKLEHNFSILAEEDAFRILSLYTNLCLCTDDTEGSIMACKQISSLPSFHSNPLVAYEYYYLSIKTQLSSGHMDIIRNCYQNCLSIANDLQDDFLAFRANLLYCMAQFGGWKDLFLCDFRIPVPVELLEQSEHYGFYNHLAYLYTMGFENDEESITKIATGQEHSVYFAKGVQLAKELGNTDFLMSAYMKNIIIYSDAGYHEYVHQMHKKRIETVKSDDKILQAHMYLGIGYNCIILENYTKADHYFREALHNLANESKADDCMDALYNICMNFFVIENYEAVIPCIDTLLKMLSALGYQNLMVCNTAKLYGMLAISYFHLQDFYNTHHFLSMMTIYMNQFLSDEEHIDHKYWEEELFLYHYIRAVLYEKEDNLNACQKELDKAYYYLWLLPGTIFYTYALYTVAQASVYQKSGQLDKRAALFEDAVTYYKKQGFMTCASKLIAISKGQKPKKIIVPFDEPDLWFDKLLTLANYTGTQNKLKYREKDIAFLTIWQENLNRSESNINTLIENAITIMQNSYSLSDVMILKQQGNSYRVLYNNSTVTLTNEKMKHFFAFFRKYKRGFLTSRTDKNFVQFMPIIEPFGKNHIVTMLGIPLSDGSADYVMLSHVNAQRNFTGNRVLLTNENFVTLKFAYSQLIYAIRQITANNMIRRMNEELEKVSMTDYLTGLYNRHGLNFIIDTKLRMQTNNSVLILYIDLDNFKYYNDTFGHEIGDFLLVHFTKIFNELVGEDGYTVRYGGDEFVIVLPNQTEQYGLQIAQAIYDQIQDGCKQVLSEHLQRDIQIPSDQKLSCSIGITEYQNTCHDDIEQALNKADQALYFIKHNSKGHAMTWTKFKDLCSIKS